MCVYELRKSLSLSYQTICENKFKKNNFRPYFIRTRQEIDPDFLLRNFEQK